MTRHPASKNLSGSDPRIREPADQEVKPPDTSNWWTRGECAEYTKLSLSTIANLERRKKLHPQFVYRKDGRGIERRVAVYDPDEVKRLPRTLSAVTSIPNNPGEVAARAFEMFNEGRDIRDVVVAVCETPSAVKTLFDEWQESAGDAPVAQRRVGEFEARCFELFTEGKAVRDVVIEVRETHDRVRAIYENWLDSGGAKLTITPAAKAVLERIVGSFASVADLLTLVEDLGKRVPPP